MATDPFRPADKMGSSHSRSPADASPAGWKVQLRESLRGKSYAEGAAQVQLSGEDEEEAPNYAPADITASIFDFFWPGMSQPPYSDQAGDFAAFCFAEAVRASRKMDWVPRPPGGRPGVGWILLQAVQIAWRKITRSTEIYEAVRATVARNQRSNYEMLKNGLDPSY